MSSELFHNKVVKQSIALESQDAFGWGIRRWRFSSNGDIDLCPDERTEARLLIPSLSTRLYLSNCFHSQFLQAWCRAIQFFSHYYFSSPLTGCSSNLSWFFSFPFKQKTPAAFTLCKAIRTSLASLPCSWKQRKVMSRLASTESASQDRLVQRYSSKPEFEFAF